MATNYDGAVEIAKSPNFIRRIEYVLVEQSKVVLSEPLATQYHADRIAFAQELVKSEIDRGRIVITAISLIVGNTGVLDPNEVDNGVTDAQLSAGIANDWNDLAGIEQGT